MTDGSVIYFLVGIVFVAGILFSIIAIARRSPSRINVQKYRLDWLKIENGLQKTNIASHSLAVVNADTLLDRALRERGFPGQTMGERMKKADKLWSSANQIWSAHKLRNRIAHETGTVVSYGDAAKALAAYKRALKDLGAI